MINGLSCGGKSSVTEILLSKNKNLFRVSTDKIKWFISKYDWNKHSEIIYRLSIELAKAALSEGFSLLIEGMNLDHKDKDFKLIAKKNKMNFFEVNIEPPFAIALKHFKNRIKESKLTGTKISNKNEKRFRDICRVYFENKNEKIPSFDSSILSPEEIAKKIEKIIK